MGLQLGKYQLVAEIARGGMGIVYLAVAQGPARFSKLLVVKELKPEFVEDDTFLEMFLEEARLAARLSHPNIVQTYEVGEENKRHYIVMDYLDGVTLSRILRRKSTLFTRNMQLRVICEILAGLHYAHTLKDFDGSDLGIVHRDVTPQNVFVTFDGTAKIVDFGIAKALDSSIETRTGILKGKPAYMAPEQISGDVDPRADIFSAGVLIWEATAGQRMWAKKSDIEVLGNMLKGEVPNIRDYVSELPEDLAKIIERSLATNRDDRFPNAAALQDALEKFLATDPSATMRDVSRVVREIFEEERVSTRAKIDSHLARLKAGGSASRLPSLLPPPESKTPTGPAPLSERSLVSGFNGTGTPAGSAISMHSAENVPVPPTNARPSRRMPWIVGAALLITGFGFAIGLGARSTEPTTTVATALPTTETPKSATPEPPAAKVAPTIPPTQAASASPPEKPKATAVTPPPQPARPVWTPPPRQPPARPATPNLSSTLERAPDPEEGKGKIGYLTIDTYPWTRVSTGGKVLGDTPLVRVPLTAGTHVIVLENTSEKVKQTTVVTIKPGENVSRRLAF
jgi:eukaryotic-like serine/threonine-protein kinase